MGGMICLRCGEPLLFSRERSWVHLDGRIYKTRLAYPRRCRRCMNSLHEGFCYTCGKQYFMEEVDDHCVLPGRG